MNFKQKIVSYIDETEYVYPSTKGLHFSKAAKIYKKYFPHSTFSCYEDLQSFVNNINIKIIPHLVKPDGSYFYNSKKALLNTIKRCLYARYADNLKPDNNKICNIPNLVNILMSYFNILYKLSMGENISPQNRSKFTGANGIGTTKESIFNAIDHFSIIAALKKLYIIVNHLIKQRKKITNIRYFQNSFSFNDIQKFVRDIPIVDHSKKINYISAISNIATKNLPKTTLYEIQLLRLYSSVLRVYHSHNFIVSYEEEASTLTMSTQTDLFKRTNNNRAYNIFNNKTTINPILKLTSNSPIAKSPVDQIYNHKVLRELNYKYNNKNIAMKEINIRKLYRPIESIVEKKHKIPFYLDIFSNGYYTDTIAAQQLKKRKEKSRIKNKILDLIQTYYPVNTPITNQTLTRFGVLDSNVISIKNTYFYHKVLEYRDQTLPTNNDNIVEPDSLVVPTSLFIKDIEPPPTPVQITVMTPIVNGSTNSGRKTQSSQRLSAFQKRQAKKKKN